MSKGVPNLNKIRPTEDVMSEEVPRPSGRGSVLVTLYLTRSEMSLPSLSVKKPVTTMMFYLGIILLGFISWSRLPQELFPPITYPQLTVVTNYPNAAPEEVESLITKIIEEAVGTVKNARRIMSTSHEGASIVIVEFSWGTNMDFAALGMREKIDLIKERLPRDAEEPVVMKFNPFDRPIMTLSVSGERPLGELYDIAKKYIKDRLEKVEGVASCSISGGIEREIKVDINGGALQNSDIDLLSVVNSLQDSNLNYPAGTTKEKFFEWLVRTIGEFSAVKDIDSTVIAVDEPEESRYESKREQETGVKKRRLIKLSDVAVIKDSFKERTSYSRYNGNENVSVSIQKQAEANTVRTIQKVMKELKKTKEILPERASINIVYDQSKFILGAIKGVTDAAVQGGMLAFLVLLFFLWNVKNSLIVTVSIPISILVSFILMYFSNISINMISLGGLALGVGMLVDGAIVVIENIFRHVELGDAPEESAIKGAEEMTAAITSTILTTVVVFLPLIFVVGIVGQIFKQLALTVTYSLMASLFVALSIIPRLTMSGAGKNLKKMKIMKLAEGLLAWSARFYSSILKKFLAHRAVGLLLIFIVFIGSLGLLYFVEKEFMPKIDEGQFMIKLDMPPGTKLGITDDIARRVEKEILDMKYVKSVTTIVGSNKDESAASGGVEMLKDNQSQIVVELEKERDINTDAFIQNLDKKLGAVYHEGAEIKFILSQSIIQSAFQESGAPIVIEVKGQDLDKLADLSKTLMSSIGKIQGVYDVKSNMEEPAPETRVVVNKDRAALYDLSVRDIARTAQIAIDGWVATKYKEEGKEIDVRVRLREEDRKNFSIIKHMRIISPEGIAIPLEEVADFRLEKGPSEIKRIDKERTVLVYANVYGRKINEVIQEISDYIDGMKLPPKFSKPKLAGEREQMKESFASLRFALILSIVLIYMIMAAQFESLWQPFIIMFTVPLSFIGVAISLFVTKTTLNVVAIFGVIILGGIIVDNGIVLIDYINVLAKEGKKTRDAIIEAANTRLRPILMTSLTTVLGLLPLALGIGEGAELQSPLAITIMGGMTVGTFLTLVVIPALYLMADEFFSRRKKVHSR